MNPYLITLPISVLCGSETWFLTLSEKHTQRMFENRVLRETRGPKTGHVTGEWRRLHYEELYDLHSSIQEMGWKSSTYRREKM